MQQVEAIILILKLHLKNAEAVKGEEEHLRKEKLFEKEQIKNVNRIEENKSNTKFISNLVINFIIFLNFLFLFYILFFMVSANSLPIFLRCRRLCKSHCLLLGY